MNNKTDLIIKILYALSAIVVLLGAFLKIMHYTNSYMPLIIGFLVGSLVSSYDTTLLRKRIKQLEEQLEQK